MRGAKDPNGGEGHEGTIGNGRHLAGPSGRRGKGLGESHRWHVGDGWGETKSSSGK